MAAQRVTPLRAAAYVVAQCGGAIAGSSVVLGLYGGADPGDLQYLATRWVLEPVLVSPSTLSTMDTRTSGLAQFGLEFLLAFMLVLTYLRVTDTQPGDQPQVGR